MIIVLENGISDNGGLEDDHRIEYHYNYLKELLIAVNRDGVDVKGYFIWSLMDDFEWSFNYGQVISFYFLSQFPRTFYSFTFQLFTESHSALYMLTSRTQLDLEPRKDQLSGGKALLHKENCAKHHVRGIAEHPQECDDDRSFRVKKMKAMLIVNSINNKINAKINESGSFLSFPLNMLAFTVDKMRALGFKSITDIGDFISKQLGFPGMSPISLKIGGNVLEPKWETIVFFAYSSSKKIEEFFKIFRDIVCVCFFFKCK